MKYIPTSRTSEGTTARPSIVRHAPDWARRAFTTKAENIPTVIMSWFNEETAPRTPVGATSDRYSGTMSAAAPTASPSTTLNNMSTATLGDSAAPMAPMQKVTAAMRIRLRLPRRSESGPATAAPAAAPRRSEATTVPLKVGLRPRSSLMNRIAPEMTPVS